MKCLRPVILALLSVVFLTGSALADYQPEHDIVVSVELLPGVIQPSGSTGESTFAAQEQAHSLLTSSTGQKVNHYYIWLYINGKPVLAVDPMRSYDFK